MRKLIASVNYEKSGRRPSVWMLDVMPLLKGSAEYHTIVPSTAPRLNLGQDTNAERLSLCGSRWPSVIALAALGRHPSKQPSETFVGVIDVSLKLSWMPIGTDLLPAENHCFHVARKMPIHQVMSHALGG